MSRNGNWFTTYSGNKFYPLDCFHEEVNIEDIGHALAMTCRFGGHCREFYSVAQHVRHVAELVIFGYPDRNLLALQALNHDSTEAYLGDVVRPLKYSMPEYLEIEAQLDRVIHDALGIPQPVDDDFDIIKGTDNALLMAERRDLVNHSDFEWNIIEEPWEKKIVPEDSQTAKRKFFELWNKLMSPTRPGRSEIKTWPEAKNPNSPPDSI